MSDGTQPDQGQRKAWKRLDVVAALAAALAALIAAGADVGKLFRSDSGPSVHAQDGGVAAGRDISGSTVTTVLPPPGAQQPEATASGEPGRGR